MMGPDDLAALPESGAAFLAAQRWLQAHPGDAPPGATGLDLIAQLGHMFDADDDAVQIVQIVGDPQDARAPAMLRALTALLKLDRADAISKATGVPIQFDTRAIAELLKLTRRG